RVDGKYQGDDGADGGKIIFDNLPVGRAYVKVNLERDFEDENVGFELK
ncbi:1495_t:CDS:2, partial [Entrophospora sp. SA101]